MIHLTLNDIFTVYSEISLPIIIVFLHVNEANALKPLHQPIAKLFQNNLNTYKIGRMISLKKMSKAQSNQFILERLRRLERPHCSQQKTAGTSHVTTTEQIMV